MPCLTAACGKQRRRQRRSRPCRKDRLTSTGLLERGTVDNSSGTGTLVAGNNDANSTFSGVLQNSAGTAAPLGLTKTGAGTLTLAGTNLFTGPATVQSGVLSLGGGGLAGPAIVTGGTLDASGFAQSIYSVSMGGFGTLNLSLGNVITSAGSDAFAGTLDIVGAIHAGELMSYAGHTGTFAASNLSGAYQLLYGSTELDIVSSGPPTWSAAGSGSWNIGTNWSSGSAPSGVGVTAVVGTATNSTVSITLDTPQTLGTLVFSNTGGNSSAGYSLDAGTAGTGSLTLDNSGTAQIVVNAGNHAITAPVYLVGGDLAVSASDNSVLTITGSISQDTTRNLTLGGDGTGELVLSGTNNLGGSGATVTVSAGTLVLNNSQAIADGTNLTVGDATFFGAPHVRLGEAVASSAPGGLGLTPVPEPATLVLLAACLGTTLIHGRRRHRRAAFQPQPTRSGAAADAGYNSDDQRTALPRFQFVLVAMGHGDTLCGAVCVWKTPFVGSFATARFTSRKAFRVCPRFPIMPATNASATMRTRLAPLPMARGAGWFVVLAASASPIGVPALEASSPITAASWIRSPRGISDLRLSGRASCLARERRHCVFSLLTTQVTGRNAR